MSRFYSPLKFSRHSQLKRVYSSQHTSPKYPSCARPQELRDKCYIVHILNELIHTTLFIPDIGKGWKEGTESLSNSSQVT